METTLITAGVICLIAAIVGGGLKGLGFEIPTLQSTHRQIMLGLFGLILIVAPQSKDIQKYFSEKTNADGVHASVSSATPTPISASASAPINTPTTRNNETVVTKSFILFFKANTLSITNEEKLKDILKFLEEIETQTVLIIGHAEPTEGPYAARQEAAAARAELIESYLISKGVDSNRIHSEGKSDDIPMTNNDTEEGRSKNRRVEIEIVGLRKN